MIKILRHNRQNSHLLSALKNGRDVAQVNQVKGRGSKKFLLYVTACTLAFVSLATFLNLTSLDGSTRFLSAITTDDKCKWIAPEFLDRPNNQRNSTLLLTSYPGSGKRLTWRLFEALTGKFTKTNCCRKVLA